MGGVGADVIDTNETGGTGWVGGFASEWVELAGFYRHGGILGCWEQGNECQKAGDLIPWYMVINQLIAD